MPCRPPAVALGRGARLSLRLGAAFDGGERGVSAGCGDRRGISKVELIGQEGSPLTFSATAGSMGAEAIDTPAERGELP